MRKPRPTTSDMLIADVIRNLKSGSYHVTVYAPSNLAFMNYAKLKTEGSVTITLADGKTIHFGFEGPLLSEMVA